MDTTTSSVSIVDAGIDWLTVTERAGTDRANALYYAMTEFLTASCMGGEGLADMAPQGYHGAGNRHGFYGQREGWVMAYGCGKAAQEMFARLRETGAEFHTTRIDVQVTAEYAYDRPAFASALHSTLRQAEASKGAKRRHQAVLYQGDSRDTGLTCGARDSKTFLRCYHPLTAGHREYSERAIRFEVEYKGDRSQTVFNAALKADGVQYLAASHVQGELMARGIREPWYGAKHVPPVKSTFVNPDNERRFEWLLNSVGPAMGRLMEDERYRTRVVDWFREIERETKPMRINEALNRGIAGHRKPAR